MTDHSIVRGSKYTNKNNSSVCCLLGQLYIFFNCLVQIQIHFDVSSHRDTVGVGGQLAISRPENFSSVSN